MAEALATHFPGMEDWLVVLLPLSLVAYLLPFFVATVRRHRFSTAIGLINLLLGWTVIGWLAAIIWAVNRDIREPGEDAALSGPPYFVNEPQLNERSLESQPAEYGPIRKCRFCAETIKAEAIVCRYCGRDLGATEAVEHQDSTAAMEKHFTDLQLLLKDRDENIDHRFAEIGPATNYAAPQEAMASDDVSARVAQQLSGWKKVG